MSLGANLVSEFSDNSSICAMTDSKPLCLAEFCGPTHMVDVLKIGFICLYLPTETIWTFSKLMSGQYCFSEPPKQLQLAAQKKKTIAVIVTCWLLLENKMYTKVSHVKVTGCVAPSIHEIRLIPILLHWNSRPLVNFEVVKSGIQFLNRLWDMKTFGKRDDTYKYKLCAQQFLKQVSSIISWCSSELNI